MYGRKDDYINSDIENKDDISLELTVDWRGAFSFGHSSFMGIGSFGTQFSDNDFSIRPYELGGFLDLSGYQKDSLVGGHKLFGAIVYQYDLGREIPGGAGLPLYLGTSIEGGNVWQLPQAISLDELATSASLYLGTDTRFGPAVVGIGYATSFGYYEQNEATLFFSIGKNW